MHQLSPKTEDISIHALLAESDLSVLHNFRPLQISIHALLAESDKLFPKRFRDTLISIHALLAESDAFLPADRMSHQEFLSTLSLRRATSLSILVI